MVLLIVGEPPKVINANLVREFVIYPTESADPDPYAIYAVYGEKDSQSIYTGELQQCEIKLSHIMAKLEPSGYDRLKL